ncbi:MAG: hypothetical protein ACTIJ6_06620 [Leucobacter sp.]
MKISTRIYAAVTVALATVFVGAPAFASEGGEKIDTLAEFSSAGQPVDVVAISIVGVVLLAVVLIGSTLVGNLFEKKN